MTYQPSTLLDDTQPIAKNEPIAKNAADRPVLDTRQNLIHRKQNLIHHTCLYCHSRQLHTALMDNLDPALDTEQEPDWDQVHSLTVFSTCLHRNLLQRKQTTSHY